jgi:hypothetical protein
MALGGDPGALVTGGGAESVDDVTEPAVERMIAGYFVTAPTHESCEVRTEPRRVSRVAP